MPTVLQTPAAVRDVNAIADWIASGSLDAALRFYDEIDRTLTLLAKYPKLGQAVDHLYPGLRRHTVRGCLLFYRPIDGGIELVRALHGSRDIDRLFD